MRIYIYWQTEAPAHNPGALFLQKPMSPVNILHAKPKPILYIYYYYTSARCVCGCVRVRERQRGKIRTTRCAEVILEKRQILYIYIHRIVIQIRPLKPKSTHGSCSQRATLKSTRRKGRLNIYIYMYCICICVDIYLYARVYFIEI